MDEEFKLCWKNFQDNIASGFQNLYDRGDLVDVTLACDGKLLHAHKIVLAICSPYFQDIFASNPCKHPIIILKDVSYNIMCELLDFMYQGVVNVKQAELQCFMKIGQLLQIKGLATNSSSSSTTSGNSTAERSAANQLSNSNEPNQNHNEKRSKTSLHADDDDDGDKNDSSTVDTNHPTTDIVSTKLKSQTDNRSRSPRTPTPQQYASGNLISQQQLKTENSSPLHQAAAYHAANAALKRQVEFNSAVDSTQLFSVKKQLRRSLTSQTTSTNSAANDQNSDLSDANESGHGMDSMSTDDFILPSISMVESRYDLNSSKGSTNSERDYRENAAAAAAAAAAVSLRNPFGPPFGFDYNLYKNSSNVSSAGGSSGSAGGGGASGLGPQTEYPNDLHMPNDYSKSFNNHMEIPSTGGSNLVMLSSTSLMHGSCVFNRNNTVATQQGMKTYWLCKSYRVSMCRARCITHQGRIISATGVHNHPPHMRATAGVPSSNLATNNLSITAINNSNTNSSGSLNYATTTTTEHISTSQTGNINIGSSNSALSMSRLGHNAAANNFAHSLHAPPAPAPLQLPQTTPITPPPAPPQLFTHHGNSAAANSQQHHTNSSTGVIQNIFQSASSLMQIPPNMLPPQPTSNSSHHHHQQHHQQQQHAPPHHHHHHHEQQLHSSHLNQLQHHQQQLEQHNLHQHHHHQHHQLQPNLEITAMLHTTSPNSTTTSTNVDSGNANALSDLSRSPSQLHMDEDAAAAAARLAHEQQVLVRNEPLSPSPDMNSSSANNDVSLSSQAENEHESTAAQHQAKIIDSITISPPNVNDSSQHFKMEDI